MRREEWIAIRTLTKIPEVRVSETMRYDRTLTPEDLAESVRRFAEGRARREWSAMVRAFREAHG